ncbi:MAG: hypothetical protein ACRDZ7_10770 [Acidimicrobiia bacterium]
MDLTLDEDVRKMLVQDQAGERILVDAKAVASLGEADDTEASALLRHGDVFRSPSRVVIRHREGLPGQGQLAAMFLEFPP